MASFACVNLEAQGTETASNAQRELRQRVMALDVSVLMATKYSQSFHSVASAVLKIQFPTKRELHVCVK
jgi:hypothetical protein